MPRILSISRNPRLLSSRNDALALAGYSVASTKNTEDAELLFTQEQFDALIIGHSVERDTRRQLIGHFRWWKPNICIVFAHTGDTEQEPLADESVDVSAGPAQLLLALQRLLGRNVFSQILAAADYFPASPSVRRKMRALLLLLRYSGLRIGDAVTLKQDRIADGRLLLRTSKTGVLVHLPLPSVVTDALDAIPSGPFYFWTGNGKVKTITSDWQEKLRELFRFAALEVACPKCGRGPGKACADAEAHRVAADRDPGL